MTKVGYIAAIALALGCSVAEATEEPEPGADFYALSPENILEVLFSSATYKLYAFRWDLGGGFEVVTATRTGKVEHCTAGEGFARWLTVAAHMTVEKKLPIPIEDKQGWDDLQIRDDSELEPIIVRVYLPLIDQKEPVLLRDESGDFAVDTDAATFGLVRHGCAALGMKR